jgi:hypothetical protein
MTMIDRAAVRLDEWLDFVVADTLKDDADVHRQAKRVAAFGVAFSLWALLFGAIYYAFGAPYSSLIVIAACVPIFGGLVAVRSGFSPVVAGNLICCGGWAALTAAAAINGGWTASPLLWYSALPVVSVLTSGAAWGLVWTVIPLAGLTFLALLQKWGVDFTYELPQANRLRFEFYALAGLVVCQFVVAWVRVGIEQRALLALRETNERLRKARETLALLETGFGFNMDEWARVQREKAALERFVRLRFGLDKADALVDEADDVDIRPQLAEADVD